ncbi:MAG TPA: putative 2OG-Fe(II) oxygenase, partial [Caulobacteraceae bacterium]|nr:putative 2OG-Fe(II) oxygenase [Caulobacteraceae bacterium]
AGDAAGAEAEARAAMRAGLDAPETWLLLGRTLEGQGRYDEAEAALREAVKRRPDYADAHDDLAQLVWRRTGDVAAATAALDAAPPSVPLTVLKARALEFAGNPAGALAVLKRSLEAQGERPGLLAAAAHAAGAIEPDAGLAWARRAAALAPNDRGVLTTLCEAELAAGEAAAALATAERLCASSPDDQLALAHRSTAARLGGDPTGLGLEDYGLVRAWRLPTPAGWPSLEAFLADLAAALQPLHDLGAHPIGQSLRGGSQTQRDLRRLPDPAIRAFFETVQVPIGEHLAWLGTGADPVRRRNRGGFRFAGVWSVRLRPHGFHADHVHPRGWLSSAFYVALPPAVRGDGREGWIRFGAPGTPTRPGLEAGHAVRPEPGMLVLFPSYMWHGTIPFGGEASRMTIAFDLVPA